MKPLRVLVLSFAAALAFASIVDLIAAAASPAAPSRDLGCDLECPYSFRD